MQTVYTTFAIGLLVPSLSFAHARLKADSTTPPRSLSTGLKSGPCGGVPRTQNPKIYKPGQQIKVVWEETINHKGYYAINFSRAKDEKFDEFILLDKYPDDQNEPVRGEPHQFSATVTLPNISCTDCTLQLVQHMEDAPGRSAPYFSCSDIQLKDDTQPPPMPPVEPPKQETASPPPGPAPTTKPAETPAPTADSASKTPAGSKSGKASISKPSQPQGLKIQKGP